MIEYGRAKPVQNICHLGFVCFSQIFVQKARDEAAWNIIDQEETKKKKN